MKTEQPTTLGKVLAEMIPCQREHLMRKTLVHIRLYPMCQYRPLVVRSQEPVNKVGIGLLSDPRRDNAIVPEIFILDVPKV